MGIRKNWNKEQMQEIIGKYQDGNSTVELGREYNVSAVAILQLLKKNNIPRRDMSHARQIYSFNENYFDNINTEDKAYWLGFICADGYLDYDRKAFQLMLSSKDKEQLSKFLKSIDSSHPIREYKNKGYSASRLYIRNILLFRALSKFIDKNKTYSLRFPKIDKELERHFIRGYFDGDGYINGKKGDEQFNITSNKYFLDELKEIIIKNLKLNDTKNYVRHKNNPLIQTMSYTGKNQIIKIKNYLYQNSTIYMERKKNVFEKIIVS